MLGYMVAGIVLGWLAWQLKHDAGDPKMVTQLIFGVLGAVIGGVGTNLVLLDVAYMDVAWVGFVGAAVGAVILLAALQVRVGRP